MNKLFSKFLQLSFPLKLIVGSIVGILAGPGLIGFLSEYATYYYAIKIGIRPPVEGIPYLKATVLSFTLFLALSAGLLFISIRFLLKGIATYLILIFSSSLIFTVWFNDNGSPFDSIKKKHQELLEKIKSFSPTVTLLSIIIISLISGLFVYFIIRPLSFFGMNWIKPILVALIIFFALLTIWKETVIWWVAICSSFIFYTFAFYFMFNINIYSSFLRTVGYGGNIMIMIEHESLGNKIQRNEYSLLLRTTQSLISLKPDKKTVIEIPIENVLKIEYPIQAHKNNREVLVEKP